MIHRVAVALTALCVVLAGLAWADDDPVPEPPLRLKKKAKPGEEAPPKDAKRQADEEKRPEPPAKLDEKPKRDEPADEPPPEPQEDEQEILARIDKNMRRLEDRLANKELGEGTSQVGRDILKDLDSLIEQQKQPPQGGQDQQQQQQQDPRDQQQQQQQGAQAQRQQQQQPGQGRQGGRRQRQQARGQGRRQLGGQAQQQQQQQPQMGQQAGKAPGGGGKDMPKDDPNKIADVYKDIWGHLPESMRQEMNAYGREKFMAKYEELLKRYYDRAAREGRRKGD